LLDLQAIVRAAKPSRGVRDEFVRSVQQSLRVEGYEVADAQVRHAVEAVVRGAK
jgi:hypothetical protein